MGFYTTGEFSVEQRNCPPIWIRFNAFGGYYTIRFEGMLQAVAQGTWVRGRITKRTMRRIKLEQWSVKSGLAAYILFLIYSLASSGGHIPADQAANGIGVLGFLAFILWLCSWRGKSINTNAQQIVSWLHEELFIPPDRAEKPDLSLINLDGLYSVKPRTPNLADLLENPLFTRTLKVIFWLIMILAGWAGAQ